MRTVGVWLAALLLGRKAWAVERERRRRQREAELKLAELVVRMQEAEERRAA
jgi:hypothetical protein